MIAAFPPKRTNGSEIGSVVSVRSGSVHPLREREELAREQTELVGHALFLAESAKLARTAELCEARLVAAQRYAEERLRLPSYRPWRAP